MVSMDKQAQSGGVGRGCPRCGGAVFEAEKVVEKGLAYHKKCFTCSKCNRPQDDKLQVQHLTFVFGYTLHWSYRFQVFLFLGYYGIGTPHYENESQMLDNFSVRTRCCSLAQ